jgi:methylthioribose-1-phosphate isomerase
MSSLKKMIVIGASALALSAGAAVTAQAQQLNTSYVDSLDWRIANAAQQGRISWSEARNLKRELRSVHDLAWRNQTGRINRWQYQRLSNVVHHVEMRTSRYAQNGGQRYGYGYGDRYGHDWRR